MQPAVDVELYSPYAFEFIHEGLDYAVTYVHGPHVAANRESRHVNGQQLCEGIRELALAKWGMLASTVLRRWNISSTLDFGRMVFTLIEAGHMQKVQEDSLDDFKNVYEFKTAFETGYRIPSQPSAS